MIHKTTEIAGASRSFRHAGSLLQSFLLPTGMGGGFSAMILQATNWQHPTAVGAIVAAVVTLATVAVRNWFSDRRDNRAERAKMFDRFDAMLNDQRESFRESLKDERESFAARLAEERQRHASEARMRHHQANIVSSLSLIVQGLSQTLIDAGIKINQPQLALPYPDDETDGFVDDPNKS
ncbi:MAG: hypothetical protein ABIP75_03135 [Pyrinomonadaceae bacterium]